MAATASDLADFRQAQNDVVTLAMREIASFWRTLDLNDPVSAVLALEAFLPEVIAAYGEIGAAAAADFYEELREQSPAVRQAYSAVMGNVVNIEQVRGSSKWAAAPLFKRTAEGLLTPDPDATLGRVLDLTDRLIKAQYRQTIVTNVERDPAQARFARVPTGPSTCAFCLTMASRGAVYSTDEEAAHKYHGHCDCVPTPIWDESDYPEGYDPDSLYETYKEARRATGSDALKGSDGILAAMREQQGIR